MDDAREPGETNIERRTFVGTVSGAVAALIIGLPTAARADASIGGQQMYGLIGKMITTPGQRDAFIAILLGGVGDMPGCLSYVVAQDPTDENALWITEVWDSQASHQASLALPAVKDAIARGRSLIAGFGDRHETIPIGGHGLAAVKR